MEPYELINSFAVVLEKMARQCRNIGWKNTIGEGVANFAVVVA